MIQTFVPYHTRVHARRISTLIPARTLHVLGYTNTWRFFRFPCRVSNYSYAKQLFSTLEKRRLPPVVGPGPSNAIGCPFPFGGRAKTARSSSKVFVFFCFSLFFVSCVTRYSLAKTNDGMYRYVLADTSLYSGGDRFLVIRYAVAILKIGGQTLAFNQLTLRRLCFVLYR